MTTIFARIYSISIFAFFVVQTSNMGWAAQNEKPSSFHTSVTSSTLLPVVEEVEEINLTHTARSNLQPIVDEYDDDSPLEKKSQRRPIKKDYVEYDYFSESQPTIMPFQLGLEFQESKGLCKWALKNNNFQRKPFFLISDQKSKKHLWKLVIDTSDIEFVTLPFTDEEEFYLARCIDSILIAFNTLQKILTDQDSVTFEDWTDLITAPLNENGFILAYFGSYNLVRDMPLIKPMNWVPTFSPQATIQHPLEYTIPLSFMLFGFDNPSYMFPFCGSLPSRNSLLAAQKAADSEEFGKIIQNYYKKKLSGLFFLHALTLEQMTSVRNFSETELLQETLDALEDFHQIDPKMRLSLMSRRPFSSMFKDLGLEIDYTKRFLSTMQDNSSFMEDIIRFPKINYAEQFFQPISGEVKPLRSLLQLFDPTFLDTNRTVLEALLDQGVISTVMLRNLKADVMTNDLQPVISLSNQYFIAAINSVAKPQERYNISLEMPGIQSQFSTHDALSPPWFLDMENSMGALKEDVLPRYGEAVVEFRCIRDVQPCFLKRVGLDSKLSGSFLVKPNDDLKNQVLSLFRYLKQFGKPKDFSDFALGMALTVSHH